MIGQKLFQAKEYLGYLLKAGNRHGLHSPFVFDLYSDIICSEEGFYAFDKIEGIRKILRRSTKIVEIKDLGAGTSTGKQMRKVADIARNAAKPAKYGQLLFRLVNYFKPQTILELGTSLGISTLYLAAPNSKSKVITIEGNENIAALASVNFGQLKMDNIELVVGNFDSQLQTILDKIDTLDFVFIDGNHRKEPTIRYFKQILSKCNNNTVIVFDDIYWSREMKEAWDYIKNNQNIHVTIDLYYLGIAFFRAEQTEQHFVLKY